MSGKIRFINLTPHPVTVVGKDGKLLATIPPSGVVARAKMFREKVSEIDINGRKVPMYRVRYGEVTGLPEPQEGAIYIVSIMVLQACKDRNDLIAPDTGPGSVVRDENGRIIGVKAFIKEVE